MGIDVNNNKQVAYNGTHQYGLNTSPATNPHKQLLAGAITVQSVFQRRQLKPGELGDGNPFIYALKNKHGFSITYSEIANFLPDFSTILASAMKGRRNVLFLAMPSSHGIANILAKRAGKYCAAGTFMPDAFVKKTAQKVANEVLALQLPKQLRGAASKLVSGLMKNKGAPFTMKDVKDHDLRRYISPIEVAPGIVFPGCDEIVLVDDLLSSGSTLLSGREALVGAGISAQISGLCLLSALKD